MTQLPRIQVFDRNASLHALPFDYCTWLGTDDNLERVHNYFDEQVGIPASSVLQDGLEYDAATQTLSFDVFVLDDKGLKTYDRASGEIATTHGSVMVDTPPPWL